MNMYSWETPFRAQGCAVHGVSLRGLSHERTESPMQDSFGAMALDSGWIVLAAADGVGSEPRADTGSRLAVRAALESLRCADSEIKEQDQAEKALRDAFLSACRTISDQAEKDGAPVHEYATTLHVVMTREDRIYIMHAGDGGVVMLGENGRFCRLTAPMKDTDGESVVPLQAGPDRWTFIARQEQARSLLVCTDGVWDKLCPPVLSAFGDTDGVEKSIGAFFMSPFARDWEQADLGAILEHETCVLRGTDAEAVPEFYSTLVQALSQSGDSGEALEYVKSRVAPGNMPLKMLRQIQDDLTLVTLVRYEPEPGAVELTNLQGPDWSAVSRWASGRLYPPAGQADEPEKKKDSPPEPDESRRRTLPVLLNMMDEGRNFLDTWNGPVSLKLWGTRDWGLKERGRGQRIRRRRRSGKC